MSKSRKLTSTFFCNKKNCLADMLVNFFLLDKVTLEEHGTTKKLSITFLLRSGQLICFDPSSIMLFTNSYLFIFVYAFWFHKDEKDLFEKN